MYNLEKINELFNTLGKPDKELIKTLVDSKLAEFIRLMTNNQIEVTTALGIAAIAFNMGQRYEREINVFSSKN